MAGTELESAVVLTEKIKNMTADEAVQIVRQLCVQLDDKKGFHGCIWPGNIRLEDGMAVLGEKSDASAADREAEQVEFLAPEFFWEDAGSPAADVYSLGLLIYAACNGGYMPFQPKGGAMTEKDRAAALRKRMKGERIPTPPGMSSELGAIVRRALAYKPEQRYESAAALLSALGETAEALPAPDEDIIALSAEEKPAGQQEKPSSKKGKKSGKAGAKKDEAGKDGPKQPEAPADQKPEDKNPGTPEIKADEPEKPGPADEKKDGADAPKDKAQAPEKPDAPKDKTKAPEKPDAPKDEAGKDKPEKADAKKDEADKPITAGTKQPVQKEAEDSAAKKDGKEPPKKGFTWDDEDVLQKAPARREPSRERPVRTGDSEKKYTVRKDFDSRNQTRRSSAAPAGRRKKKKRSSPLILILSLAAIVIIAVVVGKILFPTGDDQISEPFNSPAASGQETLSPEFTPAGQDDGEQADSGDPAEPQEEEMTVVNDTVYAIDSGVSLRVGPGTSYTVGQTLSRGTALQRTGVIGGWSQVQYENSEYYVSSALVSLENPLDAEPEGEGTALVESGVPNVTEKSDTVSIVSEANLRSGPGTTYDVKTTVRAGAVLQRTGEIDGWSRVIYNNEEVFVSNALVKTADGPAPTPTVNADKPAAEAPAETPAATTAPAPTETDSKDLGTLKITRKVNIRSGPGTDFSVLGVAQVGDSFTVTGFTAPKWYRVEYNGKQAFINDKYVDAGGATVSKDATVTVRVDSAVNIRSGAGAGYSLVGTAKAGETFTALSITDDHWYKIEYNGSTAYVSGKFVTQVD